MVVKTGSRRATWMSGYAEMMGMGVLSGAYGPLLAAQVPYFQLSLSQAGLPVAIEGIGYLLGTLAAPLIWALSRARWVLLGSQLTSILLLASVFLYHHCFNVYLVQVLFLGIVSGVIIVAVDSYLSDLHRPLQAPYLNLSHLFYGMGAFFGPIMVSGVFLWIGPWHFFFLILTLVFTAFFPFMWVEMSRANPETETMVIQDMDDGASSRPFRSVSFWLINLGMFLVLGIEFGLASWQVLFLIRVRELSPSQANLCVSSFWLALMVGRFIYIRFFRSADILKSIMAASLLAGISMIPAFALNQAGLIMFFTAGIGLGMSILYPNLLALGTTKFPGKTGLITGILSFGSGLGASFMPWLLGVLFQNWGMARSIFILPICGFSMTLLAGFIRNREERQAREIVS